MQEKYPTEHVSYFSIDEHTSPANKQLNERYTSCQLAVLYNNPFLLRGRNNCRVKSSPNGKPKNPSWCPTGLDSTWFLAGLYQGRTSTAGDGVAGGSPSPALPHTSLSGLDHTPFHTLLSNLNQTLILSAISLYSEIKFNSFLLVISNCLNSKQSSELWVPG